ncbi:glutaminyl-peptide cyclotransferase [Microbulbifer hydrolyticus]|uniref:Glutamine cyclotransferase n=1 Tax=Microbulbifer hydrolyticus TaxID=48074 RepID=A0ABX6J1M9_9GAMM|nr:glutaminyl-peptide cyclotransferase [Microbulbifer hydrolyticus]QHQ39716.1 glutamine cyclotransferase [Microbulbifer hydrolyticus]
MRAVLRSAIGPAIHAAFTTLLLFSSQSLAIEPGEYKLLESKPRPGDHFTQGLYFDGERWLESSGLYGRSWLAEYTDPGANPVRRKWLAGNRFAEGLAVLGDRLYLLTYRAGEAQVYNRSNFSLENVLSYQGEGWGLTSDGRQLIMSNGSDTLTFRDPDTFEVIRRLPVTGGGERWSHLNELEYVHGLIWANIWKDPRIIAIDPDNGEVKGILNLEKLQQDSLQGRRHVDAVANGIAWDRARNGLWVTGKYWPKLYLIRPDGLGF